MNRIALVVPHFGAFKNYFAFWVQSCKNNPAIDFLIFTDNSDALEYITRQVGGGNFKTYLMPFGEIRRLIEKKLNFSISLDTPYKLCDFKPMYGLIFEDYLIGYDYWGHCDNDLIFGNISTFLTEDILGRYDRLFSRGHLSIYRNTEEVNHFFKQSEGCDGIVSWKSVSASPQIYAFDEWGGTSRLWSQLRKGKMYDEIVFDDIAVLKKHFVSCQKKSVDRKNKSHFIFEYNNGNLFRIYYDENDHQVKKESTLYVHFQKRDMTIQVADLNHYLIIPNTFIPYQEPNTDLVLSMGKKYYFYKKYWQIRWHNLVRRIHFYR